MNVQENFINHAELEPYFNNTMSVLIGESDRGALLLGVSQIDETLQSLFEKLTPTTVSKTRKNSIFNFNGPFGSISSKLDVALVCRILPEDLIDAIHRIRKIRNNLAHKIDSFELIDYKKELNEILALTGPNADAGITRLSAEIMMNLCLDKLCDLQHDDGTPMFESREYAIKYISDNENILNILEKQHPKWTFAIAVGVICALILLHREKICAAMDSNSTILNLIAKSKISKRTSKSKKASSNT